MTKPIEHLIQALGKLPGIGEKTATRLAFFLLRSPKEIALDLGEALQRLHATVKLCPICCNIADQEPCTLCRDTRRDHAMICVVAEPSDVKVLEKTGSFRGSYHVLHGALSPLDGIGPQELRIEELLARIEREKINEVILAMDANVEGDATSLYLSRLLQELGCKVSRLGVGIPVGGELEYLDPSTLSKALEERREMR